MTTDFLSAKKNNSTESIFYNNIFNNFSNYNNLYEFRSKYRLNDDMLNAPSTYFTIDNINDYKCGIAVIDVDGVKFNTFLFDSSVKKLYITLTSGNRKKNSSVLFTRWKWRNYFDGIFLAIDDPMFEYHKTFPFNLMGWYYGTRDNNFLDKTVKLIQELARVKDVSPENIVLLGSSSGAMASLYISNYLPACSTIAYNPQFSLADWPYASEFEHVTGVDLKCNDKRNIIKIKPNLNNKYLIYYNLLSHEDMPQMRSLLNSLGFSYSNIKYGLNKLTDNIYLLASVVDYHNNHITAPNEYESYIISRFLELSSAEKQKICDNEFFTYMTENISRRYVIMDKKIKLNADAKNVNTEMFQYAKQSFEKHVNATKHSDIIDDFKALFFLKSFSLPKSYFKTVVKSLKELGYDKSKFNDYFKSCTSNSIIRAQTLVDELKNNSYCEPQIMNSYSYLLETLFKSPIIISKYREAFQILCRALKNNQVSQPNVHDYTEIEYVILSDVFISDDLSFTKKMTNNNCYFVSNICNLIGFKEGYSAFVTNMHNKENLISHTIDFFFRNLLGCLVFNSMAQYKQTFAAYYYSRKTARPNDYGEQIKRISRILAGIITSEDPETLIRILGNELIRLIAVALDLPSDKFLIFEHLAHPNMVNCRNYLKFAPPKIINNICL